MNKLLNILRDHLTDLALPIAMLFAAMVPALALSPAAAWADDSSQLDLGRRGGGGGGEGRPLDTNDADGEGDPNDDVHNSSSAWTGSGGDSILRLSPTTRFILIPRFDGKSLSFEVIMLDTEGKITRRSHAR